MPLLADIRQVIPFLKEVPEEIYFNLNDKEFYMPEGEVALAREELEQLFGHHVMTYKADVFRRDLPLQSHLCARFQGARLTRKQIQLLNRYESKYKSFNVRFVVYQKPLKQITIQDSPFF